MGDEIGDYKYKDKVIKYIIVIGRLKVEFIKNGDNSVNRDVFRRVELKYEININ